MTHQRRRNANKGTALRLMRTEGTAKSAPSKPLSDYARGVWDGLVTRGARPGSSELNRAVEAAEQKRSDQLAGMVRHDGAGIHEKMANAERSRSQRVNGGAL